MNPFAELVSIVINIYISIILLRFFMQYFRADYYNPLSQFVIKATDPLVRPLRKIIPGFLGLDVSSLLLAWLVSMASILLVALLTNSMVNVSLGQLLLLPIFQVIDSIFGLFTFLIIVRAILSWLPSAGYNPIIGLLHQLTDPLLAKCRRLLPPTSGFDFSPIIALLGLMFLSRVMSYYIYPVIIKLLL